MSQLGIKYDVVIEYLTDRIFNNSLKYYVLVQYYVVQYYVCHTSDKKALLAQTLVQFVEKQ